METMRFEYQFKPVGYATNEELADNEVFIAIGNEYGDKIFDKSRTAANACRNIFNDAQERIKRETEIQPEGKTDDKPGETTAYAAEKLTGLDSLVTVKNCEKNTVFLYTQYFPDPDAILSVYMIEYYLRYGKMLSGEKIEKLIAGIDDYGDRNDRINKEIYNGEIKERAANPAGKEAPEDIEQEVKRLFVLLSMLEKKCEGARKKVDAGDSSENKSGYQGGEMEVISKGMILYGKLLLDDYFGETLLTGIEAKEFKEYEPEKTGAEELGKHEPEKTGAEELNGQAPEGSAEVSPTLTAEIRKKLTAEIRKELFALLIEDKKNYDLQMRERTINTEATNLWLTTNDDTVWNTRHKEIAVWMDDTTSVFARRYAFQEKYNLVMTVKPRKNGRKQISIKAKPSSGETEKFDISSLTDLFEIMEQQIEEDAYQGNGRYQRNHAFPRKNAADKEPPKAPGRVTSDPWFSPDPQTVYSPGIGTYLKTDYIVKLLRHITRMVNITTNRVYISPEYDECDTEKRFPAASAPEGDQVIQTIPLRAWEKNIKGGRNAIDKDDEKKYFVAVTMMDSSLISYENRTLKNYLAAVLDNARCDTQNYKLHKLFYDIFLDCDANSAVFVIATTPDADGQRRYDELKQHAQQFAEELVSLSAGYDYIIKSINEHTGVFSKKEIDRLKAIMYQNEERAFVSSNNPYREAFEIMKENAGFNRLKKRAEDAIDDAARSINRSVLEKLDVAKYYLIPFGILIGPLTSILSLDEIKIPAPANVIIFLILIVFSIVLMSGLGERIVDFCKQLFRNRSGKGRPNE